MLANILLIARNSQNIRAYYMLNHRIICIYVIIPYLIGLDHCTVTQMSLYRRSEVSFVLIRSKYASNAPRADLEWPSFIVFPRIP